MSREDAIALRWPRACMICGIELPPTAESRYAIIGKFHTIKDVQVLLKLPGFFYTCNSCNAHIKRGLDHPYKRISDLADRLQEHPWNEFIELEKDGTVRLSDGRFKEILVEMNPELRTKSKKDPMQHLIKLLSHEGEK